MQLNLYRRPCHYCDQTVPAMHGKAWHDVTGWHAAHGPCITGAEIETPPPPRGPQRKRRSRKKGGAVAIDYGGDARGKRIPSKGNVEMYECAHCGHRQREVKAARRRATRVRCPNCSAVVQPMTAHRPTPEKRPKCKNAKCRALLPVHASIAYCDACFNAMTDNQRTNVLNGRPPGGIVRWPPPSEPPHA